jgi:hypothetical protein
MHHEPKCSEKEGHVPTECTDKSLIKGNIEGKEAEEVTHNEDSADEQVKAPTPCGDPMRAFAHGQGGQEEEQRAAPWMPDTNGGDDVQ